MNFFDVINARRSVRRFTPKTVPDEVIQKAFEAALKAPNSSNLQPWEFYWFKSSEKKSELAQACLFQGSARTANHLVVAVSRIDTWRRNRDLIVNQMEQTGPLSKEVHDYYYKTIPSLYRHDPLGIFALARCLIFSITGLFKPSIRKPVSQKDLFEIVTKSTALACENFMLAITAQGYSSCPMEGFDEKRIKKILSLNSKAHVVMVIAIGDPAPEGIFGPQIRMDPKLVIYQL